MRFVTLSLAGLLAACAVPDVPGSLRGAPWTGQPGDDEVLAARDAMDRGEERAALAAVESVLRRYPAHVDAHRVRQDLLRRRGRIGLVMSEAEQRVRISNDATSIYLRGRAATRWQERLDAFEAAVEAEPDLFWGWLGLAFTLRQSDPERSLAIYEDMYEATREHPLVAISLASLLRSMSRFDDSVKVYSRLRESALLPGVADLGLAEAYLSADQPREAWPALLQGLRTRPFDPGARRLVEAFLTSGLRDDEVERVLDVLAEDPERLAMFGRAHGAVILAALFERRGNLPAACESLIAEGLPKTAAARRHWRNTLLSSGDVVGFLSELRDHFPAYLLDDERNQIRSLWVTLLRGPWYDVEDPLADPASALGLTEALMRVGMLEECDRVATLALLRHRDAADRGRLEDLRAEARREVAFEGALKRLLYTGYGGERVFTLEMVLDHVRRLSRQIFGEDVVGEPEVFQVPFVGQLVNPFAAGLGEHFARYNKHLVLGQRNDSPAEGLLQNRLSLRYLEPSADLRVPGQCWQVVCEDRKITSLQGVLGGDLAGVALLNHYVIDMDAVRDWAASLLERRAIVREDGHALLDDPLPNEVDPLDPVDVHWRLPELSSVEDTRVEHAVFDMICWHERAHLVDSFRFLPPEGNLWRVLGLLISHGFSSFSIESEMEGRAETAALAFSPHTRLVLAHIASFLNEESAESPHAVGFRRLAQRVNDALAEDPESADLARASRWHLVAPERMRQIARDLVRDS